MGRKREGLVHGGRDSTSGGGARAFPCRERAWPYPLDLREAEFAPVACRRHAGEAQEEPAERGGIAIADFMPDRLRGSVCRFEKLLRFLDPQRLHIGQRRI